MRYVLIFKSTAFSEAGVKCDPHFAARREAYAKSLANAGMLLADGVAASSSGGFRITLSPDGEATSTAAGPFSAESGLMESFIMLEAHSIEEALEWAKKAPVPKGRGEAEIELRQLSDQEETYHDPNIMAMETNLREHI